MLRVMASLTISSRALDVYAIVNVRPDDETSTTLPKTLRKRPLAFDTSSLSRTTNDTPLPVLRNSEKRITPLLLSIKALRTSS